MSDGVREKRRHGRGVGPVWVERRSDHMECGICHWSGQRDNVERLLTGAHRCPMCHSQQVYEAPEW
jgi:hypothetical protein